MRGAWLVFVLLAGSGCAGFGDAFEERIERPLHGQPVTVSLACSGPRAALPRAGSRLRLEPVADRFGQGRRVGTMLDQASPDGIALLLEDARVADRLARDVAAALAPAPAHAPELAIRVAVEQIWVWSRAARWSELQGEIRARVAFRAALIDAAAGRTRWERAFEAEALRDVVYFRAADHEAALGEAWCAALSAFSEALSGEDFRAALGGW